MDDLRPFLRRRPDGRCRLMGILNATPDSFHEASRVDLNSAVTRGLKMWSSGADWIDVGGESTRPGAKPVNAMEEMARVIPVIKALREANPNGLISIDSRRPDVARAALYSADGAARAPDGTDDAARAAGAETEACCRGLGGGGLGPSAPADEAAPQRLDLEQEQCLAWIAKFTEHRISN